MFPLVFLFVHIADTSKLILFGNQPVTLVLDQEKSQKLNYGSATQYVFV